MLKPISDFLPALKGGANLAGPAPGSVETLADAFPVTMSGDAWESAAVFVIRQRGNPDAWQEIGQFLKEQELKALGLRVLPTRSDAARQGPACGMGPRGIAAHPVGNTGITSTIVNGGSNG